MHTVKEEYAYKVTLPGPTVSLVDEQDILPSVHQRAWFCYIHMYSNRFIRLSCLVYQKPLEPGPVLLKGLRARQNKVGDSRSSSVYDYINKRLGNIQAPSLANMPMSIESEENENKSISKDRL